MTDRQGVERLGSLTDVTESHAFKSTLRNFAVNFVLIDLTDLTLLGFP